MELIKVNELVYYINSRTNIGVIKNHDGSVILIDSGIDEESGKKILGILKESELNVKAVINTHSHADHCGANRYIQERTGATIYGPEGIESSIIQNPLIEPIYLFSGARPVDELRNRFLMAEPSQVTHTLKEHERINFGGIDLQVIPLPGHSYNQIGIEVGEVLFCADSIFSQETIDKHKIPFFVDIEKARETLRFLKDSKYKFYIPSHAQPRESLSELVDLNLKAIEGIEKNISEILKDKKTIEQIVREVCNVYRIEIAGLTQYFLLNTSVMAYLSSMNQKGKIKAEVQENLLSWKNI